MNYFLFDTSKHINTCSLSKKNISSWTKILVRGVVAGFIGVVTAQSAQAITFTESGDTGGTLSEAQVLPAGVDRIDGRMGFADKDLYQFSLGTDTPFTATAVGLAGGRNTELFLFDSVGGGIIANDDTAPGILEPTINTSLTAGTYYLGFANNDLRANDADGTEWTTGTPPANFDTLDTLSGGGALVRYDYSISLTPATSAAAVSAAAVPLEFSPGLGLLIVGAGFGLKYAQKQANRRKVNIN